jgi:hypothetical protein
MEQSLHRLIVDLMSCGIFNYTSANPLTSHTNILPEEQGATAESRGFMEDTVWQYILQVVGNVPWDIHHRAASSYLTHLALH